MLVLPFPVIDPVMIHLGSLAVHWYGVAYVTGLILGWQYAIWLARCYAPSITKKLLDDFLMWALGGVIIGGRLGHVLFFEPQRYWTHFEEILMTWKGGMSFHGGLIGVIVAALAYCRKHHLSTLRFGDIIATVAPIGLFLGRIANFVNGELFGRVTDVPWAMVFPYGGALPRHPSQLYEAFLEGLLLLLVLSSAWKVRLLRDIPGRIMGLFYLGYGLARFLVEFVREPDSVYVFFSHTPIAIHLTTGQLLSIPLILTGGYFTLRQDQKFT